MAAPDTGRTERKFTNSDVAEVFAGPHRRELGKIELSAKEVMEILNEEVLDEDTTVTRQAVDKRLNNLVDESPDGANWELVRKKHGRSHLYYRDSDLDKIFTTADGGALLSTLRSEWLNVSEMEARISWKAGLASLIPLAVTILVLYFVGPGWALVPAFVTGGYFFIFAHDGMKSMVLRHKVEQNEKLDGAGDEHTEKHHEREE